LNTEKRSRGIAAAHWKRRSHYTRVTKLKLIGARKMKCRYNPDAECLQNCCKECDTLLKKWGSVEYDGTKFVIGASNEP